MYKIPKFEETSIKKNDSYEGETIEQKVERIINNKEPITDGAPIIYQDRADGIEPSYDIRTDRHDYAIDAMDKVAASKRAKREETLKELNEKEGKKDTKKTGENTEGESTQGTSESQSQSTGK